jgi:hypothetical protein
MSGGSLSAYGNITGNYIKGDGSQLSNVVALNANVVTVSNNQEYRPLLATSTSGNLPFKASSGISWNPSTYALTAGKILLGAGIGAQGITGTYAFGGNTAWKVQSQNGTGTDAAGQEIGRFGSEYNNGASTFWDSYVSYYQGSGANSGWLIINAGGNAVANVTGTGISVTGTISASGNVAGANFIGNGGTLSNVSISTGNLTTSPGNVQLGNLIARIGGTGISSYPQITTNNGSASTFLWGGYTSDFANTTAGSSTVGVGSQGTSVTPGTWANVAVNSAGANLSIANVGDVCSVTVSDFDNSQSWNVTYQRLGGGKQSILITKIA